MTMHTVCPCSRCTSARGGHRPRPGEVPQEPPSSLPGQPAPVSTFWREALRRELQERLARPGGSMPGAPDQLSPEAVDDSLMKLADRAAREEMAAAVEGMKWNGTPEGRRHRGYRAARAAYSRRLHDDQQKKAHRAQQQRLRLAMARREIDQRMETTA